MLFLISADALAAPPHCASTTLMLRLKGWSSSLSCKRLASFAGRRIRSIPATSCSQIKHHASAKKYVRLGASPRAGQALISAGKVLALIKGRYNVAYSDINHLARLVLRHRIKLKFEAIAERISADQVIDMILEELAKKYKIK